MAKDRFVQTASHWGVYSVGVDGHGEISGVKPLAQDPSPTPLIHSLPEMVRSPLRINQPHVRAEYLRHREKARHSRGVGPFVPVSWDVALKLVEDELQRVKVQFGNEAIYGGSSGWASAGRFHHSASVLKRFLGLHGGYTDKRGNHSFGAALGILPFILGTNDVMSMVVPWSSIVSDSKLVVMFGGAHTKNMQLDAGGTVKHENPAWIARAAAAGIKFINISPSRQDVAEVLKPEWLPIRPNTDMALMLGLAHTLVAEGLHDRAFLERYCLGFENFKRYLIGQEDGVIKDAAWASSITAVPAETIVSLAQRMARVRTLITTSWSAQRADHGEQIVWMTVVLAAMLGQIGLPGGGFSFGFAAVNGIAISRPEHIPRPTLPLGPNPVKTFVPAGRVADMLLHPGSELEYSGTRLRMPDIKLIYSLGGNPFHHTTNLNRFLRAWQQPDTVIVHEPWWSPPAKHADIVLPATTTMERNDILATEHQRHYVAMHQVIPPVAQSRNDFDIFADLAQRLGFHDSYVEGRDEMGWLRHMYDVARQKALQQGFDPPDFDRFWSTGYYEFPMASEDATLPLAAFVADPEKRPLETPSGRIEIFSRQIEKFGYDDCPPRPTWLEPAEWLGGALASRFPLHLLSNQPTSRLHSQLDASSVSMRGKLGGRERLLLNRRDAADRGIRHGDVVRVFNDRGAFLAAAVPSDEIMPGVAQIPTGAWYDPETPGAPSLDKHGNPNVVTLDKGTSRLAQSTAAQTALVEIERCNKPPAVTAFDIPIIVAT